MHVDSAHLWVLECVQLTVLVESLHWVHFLVRILRVPARIITSSIGTQKTSHVDREAEFTTDVCRLEAGQLALYLDGLAWELGKLDEARSGCRVDFIAANSIACSIDGLVEVCWGVGNHRRAILCVRAPPSRSVHSITGFYTPWVGMTVLVCLLLVEVAICVDVVAIT